MSDYPTDYPACGLWPARTRIAASILDGDGQLHRRWIVADTECERWDSLLYLEREFGLDMRLVIPDVLARANPIGRTATQRRLEVLLVSDPLVAAICSAAFGRRTPRQCANVLARLPGSLFRGHLRSPPPRDWRQLPLL